MLKKLIFLSGLRKSGTSMVRNLLDNHPEFFSYPFNEFPIFKFTHYDKVLRENDRQKLRRREMSAIIEDIVNDKWWTNARPKKSGESQRKNRRVDEAKFRELLRQSSPETYKELIEDVLVNMARSTYYFQGDLENLQVAVKSVQDEEHFPELLKWFPHLKFVYILRNPYAQFNSVINNMRHAVRGVEQKHKVDRDVSRLSVRFPYPYLGERLKQMRFSYYFMRKYSRLEPEHFYVLNYDKLLQSPEEELHELCKFLEIEFHPNLMEVSVGGKPRKRKGWSVGRHNANRISAKPLDAWKEQLPPLAIRLVNMYFQDVIEDYGFEFVPSKCPLWKPFSRSERPIVYVANRLLFMRNVEVLMR